jgi:MoaA/NifB/PqqE/SkfB family radical SAM enzyme
MLLLKDHNEKNHIACYGRKERIDRLFFDNGIPTGYYRNFLKQFSAIKAAVEGRFVAPVSVEIQPSGTCNLTCRYCGFKEKRAEHSSLYITEEQIERLIEEIDDYNSVSVNKLTDIKFNGIFSEPLAGHAKKATIAGIKLAQEKGFRVGLFTNGIELDDEVRQELVGKGSRSASFVNISIDAAKGKTYQILKKQGATEEQAEKELSVIFDNIKKLIELKNATGAKTYVSISCILQEENCNPTEIGMMIEKAKVLKVTNIRFRCPYKRSQGAPETGKIEKACDIIAEYAMKYQDDKEFSITMAYDEKERAEYMEWLFDGSFQKKEYTKCRASVLRLTIGPDGNFYLCDHRGYVGGGKFGSINDGYGSVVESDIRKKCINGIKPQEDLLCEFCAMYDHYLNHLFGILEDEYEKDCNVFDWLIKEYDIINQLQASDIEALLQTYPIDKKLRNELSNIQFEEKEAWELKEESVRNAHQNVKQYEKYIHPSTIGLEIRLQSARRLKKIVKPNDTYKGLIDLHCHSFASDGNESATWVVYEAWRSGLESVGVVNHNSLEDMEEAVLAGEIFGIDVIPGIEFDTMAKVPAEFIEREGIDDKSGNIFMHFIVYFPAEKDISGNVNILEYKRLVKKIRESPLGQFMRERFAWYLADQEIFRQRFNVSEWAVKNNFTLTQQDLILYSRQMFWFNQALSDRLNIPYNLVFDRVHKGYTCPDGKYPNIYVGGGVVARKLYNNENMGNIPVDILTREAALLGGVTVIAHPTDNIKGWFKRHGIMPPKPQTIVAITKGILEQNLTVDVQIPDSSEKEVRLPCISGIEVFCWTDAVIEFVNPLISAIEEVNRKNPMFHVFPAMGSDIHMQKHIWKRENLTKYIHYLRLFDPVSKIYKTSDKIHFRLNASCNPSQMLERHISSGIDTLITHLPKDMQELLDMQQPMEYHAEGPTLKHHLQAMLTLINNTEPVSEIYANIKEILDNPDNRAFFEYFIVFHDIGKKIDMKNHAEESCAIMNQFDFSDLNAEELETLRKAVRYHMEITDFVSVDPERFERFLNKTGIQINNKHQIALIVAAIYLDGRSTWSNEMGDYCLPNVDYFCQSYLAYTEMMAQHEHDLKIIDDAVNGEVNQDALADFLAYLRQYPLRKAKRSASSRELLPVTEHRNNIEKMLNGEDIYTAEKDNYGMYKSGEDYNASEFIDEAFRDNEFLDMLCLLTVSLNGREQVAFKDQQHLLAFVESCSQGITDVLCAVSDLAYKYYDNEVKDCINEYFPCYIRMKLDAIIADVTNDSTSGELLSSKQNNYKLFTDILLKSLYFQVDSMQKYNEFLTVQFYQVMELFRKKLKEFTVQINFHDNYTPVLLLRDAEPLSYPLFEKLSTHKPELVYFNRLATMTPSERLDYFEKNIDKKSEYTKTLFASETKIYSFFNGSAKKNIPSVLEESAQEAHAIARRYFYDCLEENAELFDRASEQYKDDVQRLFILLITKKLLGLMNSNRKIRYPLNEIYVNFVPKHLQGKENNNQNIVFIDSGIKGTLAYLMASLMMIEHLDGATLSIKQDKINRIIENADAMRNYPICARAFIYGTTAQYRSVIPNAGFERFGFGGANTFIDQLPKFTEFSFMNEKGIPECRMAKALNVRRARNILYGFRWFVKKGVAIRNAQNLADIKEIITERSDATNNPLYIFIDIDGVTAQPVGHVGSEAWYGEETSAIPDRDKKRKTEHFDYYKRYMRHLVDSGGYRLLLDIRALKEYLKTRYPGKEIKIISFSARNETQRDITEETLEKLNVLDYFDEVNLSQKIGMSKKDRLINTLTGYGVGNGHPADIFLIDDVLHHIVPILTISDLEIIPILYADNTINDSEKSGLYFFRKADNLLRENNVLAQEFFINAFKNKHIPLCCDDITGYVRLRVNEQDVLRTLLNGIELSLEWLIDDDRKRLGTILFDLIDSGSMATSLFEFRNILSEYPKCVRQFSDVLAYITQKEKKV